MEGIDESIVNVVLTTGGISYCTAYDDFNGRDGTDGRAFQGKNSPPPAACPEAPSPSGAFLDHEHDVLD
jgi:hypothetical protein